MSNIKSSESIVLPSGSDRLPFPKICLHSSNKRLAGAFTSNFFGLLDIFYAATLQHLSKIVCIYLYKTE